MLLYFETKLPGRWLSNCWKFANMALLSVGSNLMLSSAIGLSRVGGCQLVLVWVALYRAVLFSFIIIIITTIELSFGGSSPYISTDKINKNKYT